MKVAKLAAASLVGVVVGVALEHHVRDGINWLRGKLGLPALPVSGPAKEEESDANPRDLN